VVEVQASELDATATNSLAQELVKIDKHYLG
jgi:hypothetical protein